MADLDHISPFGSLPSGETVERVSISNRLGMRATILTYGATLQTLTAPDKNKVYADIVLGHDDLAPYVDTPSYFGVIAGRYANRIAGAAFTIDGHEHKIVANEGPNTLHGGKKGFDKVIWRIVHSDPHGVTLAYTSPDGDQGFPGALETLVTYRLSENANELTLFIEARTAAATVVSITNHAYFNLAGAASGRDVLDHRLMIAADSYTPVAANLIPTGEIRAVAGTAFDFRAPRAIGERIDDPQDEQVRLTGGYDHNLVLRPGERDRPRLAAQVEEPGSGRVLELLTTTPGVQFYSANYMNERLRGKNGASYRKRSAFCLEPQHFPNAPNQANFPTSRLNPGEVYRHTTHYRFSTTG